MLMALRCGGADVGKFQGPGGSAGPKLIRRSSAMTSGNPAYASFSIKLSIDDLTESGLRIASRQTSACRRRASPGSEGRPQTQQNCPNCLTKSPHPWPFLEASPSPSFPHTLGSTRLTRFRERTIDRVKSYLHYIDRGQIRTIDIAKALLSPDKIVCSCGRVQIFRNSNIIIREL